MEELTVFRALLRKFLVVNFLGKVDRILLAVGIIFSVVHFRVRVRARARVGIRVRVMFIFMYRVRSRLRVGLRVRARVG